MLNLHHELTKLQQEEWERRIRQWSEESEAREVQEQEQPKRKGLKGLRRLFGSKSAASECAVYPPSLIAAIHLTAHAQKKAATNSSLLP